MTAADLAGRAGRNMLEAQQSLAGREVVVQGVVRETTLATREQVVVSGRAWGWQSATATKQQEQLPLVVLEPGSVLCYFEPADIGDAASVKAGDSVSFGCEVQSFQNVQQISISVLAGCRRAK